MYPTTSTLEITHVDAPRWALLHAPIGFLVGIIYAAMTIGKMHFPSSASLSAAIFFVVLVSAITAMVALAGFLQATLINVLIALLKRGPLLTVREPPVEPALRSRPRSGPALRPVPPPTPEQRMAIVAPPGSADGPTLPE